VDITTQEVHVPADDIDDTQDTVDSEDTDDIKEIDDIKAKMREALKSKQARDRGSDGGKRKEEKAPGTHGPLGGVHMHRRKAGGGGS
jgi:Family of unknown function (DUF5302)